VKGPRDSKRSAEPPVGDQQQPLNQDQKTFPLRLIIGLGNPGQRYARTRHNMGFRLLEALAPDQAPWKDFRGLGRFLREGNVILAQPLTYMNESGHFVEAFGHFYKIFPAEMLICFDDVALPLGRLRLKARGSSGGQKGMQSIIEALGTDEIPRLRIGVGPQPEDWDSTDFVLSSFSGPEEKTLTQVLDRAREAVCLAATEGISTAMNRFNSKAEV
jgi:PTH1 family peptidyl-tRNA hydrolase